jgi:putative exosortase-associated protein (TIGR04073 family)
MKPVLWIGFSVALTVAIPHLAAHEADPAARQGRDEVDAMMTRYNLHPAFEKAGRGVSNFLGGWLEIPLGVDQKYSKVDTAGSFFTGLGIGAFKGVVRTGVGVYEIFTFFLPLPEDYAPILPTLPYFQKTDRRRTYPLE